MNNEQTDRLLMLARDDINALEALYTDMHKELFAYSVSTLRDAQNAEDAVNETFARLIKLVSSFKASGRGRAYVYRICRLVCMEIMWKSRRELLVSPPEAPAGPDADTHFLLSCLMDKLNRRELQVIILRYYNRMTFKEIAQVLHAPESTVKWRHSRALEKCRGYLEEDNL